MVPLEVLPSIDEAGLVKLCMHSEPLIERRVADALIRLTSCRSENRKKTMSLKEDEAVIVEVSLEELAMVLERVDFQSWRLEEIKAIEFWPHLLAAMEFLEALGYDWENDLGFDYHQSYVVRWRVAECLIGYLVWLLREGEPGLIFPLRRGTSRSRASARGSWRS